MTPAGTMKRSMTLQSSRPSFLRRFASAGTLAFVLTALLPFHARSVTLDHFGFAYMQVNHKLPLGTRPLLLIVANFDGPPALAKRGWESLIFTGATSLTEYYREVSNGRFYWTKAGILQVNFSQEERMTITRREQMIAEAVYRKGVDLADFDANDDGVVTGDELSILIIHNRADNAGQTGWVDLVLPSASSPPFYFINLRLSASDGAHTQSFMTFCHEICHTLGATDLYGNGNLHPSISLMGPTIAADSNMSAYHLDPWHKLALGWSEPRIFSLRGNGKAIIPAAQLKRADAPVLLFDPLRGPAEFYLLEYRTNNTSAGARFDADVAQQGLLIWHVWQNPDHSPVQRSPHTTLPYPTQTGWTFCKKCNGNFYREGQGLSHCPSNGTHQPYDSHDFSMVWMDPNQPVDPGEQNWRWCRKCQGMFFGNALPNRCPADSGSHDGSQSANYILRLQSQMMNRGQRGWRKCRNCQALFYALDLNGNLITAAGVCPVSGQHDGQSSSEYTMHYDISAVFNEAAGNVSEMTLGTTNAWNIGDVTPYSRWFSDASQVRVRFKPKRYLNGGDELEVEWISELPPPPFSGETWVDYNSLFSPGDGTFFFPFRSLSRAVDDAPFYRRILIKPGAGSERLTIRQSVQLEAPLGPVTIGP